MQKPKLNKVKYSFPEALLILAVSVFAAPAGSLIGLMIDCFILNIDSSAIITEVWSELRFTIAISLFSFFGTMLYFHYDNFKINWQRKKGLQNTIKRI
ncbi:hypothetical protein [Escherichia phage LH2]|nr:hypothetical protein [Escherichia phage LH2]